MAVIQCHSVGMHLLRKQIASALTTNLKETINTIYAKSGNTLPRDYAANHQDEFLLGDAEGVEVIEHDSRFIIDFINGQKTGFFIDQRENRNLLQRYIKDKTVLNLFSYTGGFSIYALNGGAAAVTSIDVSQRAMDTCQQNVAFTESEELHTSLTVDVNKYLGEIESDKYDVIVVCLRTEIKALAATGEFLSPRVAMTIGTCSGHATGFSSTRLPAISSS